MSRAARTTGAAIPRSPTTPVVTGIAPNARELLRESGSLRVRSSYCRYHTSTSCFAAGPNRRHCLPKQGRDLRHPVQGRCASDSERLAAMPKLTALGHEETSYRFLRDRIDA